MDYLPNLEAILLFETTKTCDTNADVKRILEPTCASYMALPRVYSAPYIVKFYFNQPSSRKETYYQIKFIAKLYLNLLFSAI